LEILDRGISTVTFKENLFLKKAKILIQLQRFSEAESLLAKVRQQHGLKSWIESIEFYCKIGNYKEAWKLCETIYKREKDEKVFELAYRIQKKVGKYEDCRAILEKGV
jgi:tetratricopeptide (TPR) repeat protein